MHRHIREGTSSPPRTAAHVSDQAAHPVGHGLLFLQRSAGNRATAGLVQVQRTPGTAVAGGRAEVETALRTHDVGDVKAITDVNVATDDEKIQLIEILLQQRWVGPRDEYKLEELWGSFGDRLGDRVRANQALWT